MVTRNRLAIFHFYLREETNRGLPFHLLEQPFAFACSVRDFPLLGFRHLRICLTVLRSLVVAVVCGELAR